MFTIQLPTIIGSVYCTTAATQGNLDTYIVACGLIIGVSRVEEVRPARGQGGRRYTLRLLLGRGVKCCLFLSKNRSSSGRGSRVGSKRYRRISSRCRILGARHAAWLWKGQRPPRRRGVASASHCRGAARSSKQWWRAEMGRALRGRPTIVGGFNYHGHRAFSGLAVDEIRGTPATQNHANCTGAGPHQSCQGYTPALGTYDLEL